jgi:MscS family membrane protein
VRYDDVSKLPMIVEDVKSMLKKHPEIEQSQTMIVNFNSFAPSSLDFFVYTFTKTTEWIKFHEIKQDVLFKISEVIKKHNAEIAFPTSTVHLPDAIEVQNAQS